MVAEQPNLVCNNTYCTMNLLRCANEYIEANESPLYFTVNCFVAIAQWSRLILRRNIDVVVKMSLFFTQTGSHRPANSIWPYRPTCQTQFKLLFGIGAMADRLYVIVIPWVVLLYVEIIHEL